jgi:HEAT repeat protein
MSGKSAFRVWVLILAIAGIAVWCGLRLAARRSPTIGAAARTPPLPPPEAAASASRPTAHATERRPAPPSATPKVVSRATPAASLADDALVAALIAGRSVASREPLLQEIARRGNACLPSLRRALWTLTEPADLQPLCRALTWIGTPESVRLFVECLDDPRHRLVREALAPALLALERSEPAADLLRWMTAETNEAVATAVIEALQRVGDTNLVRSARVLHASPSTSPQARQDIRTVLAELRDTNTVPLLAIALQEGADADWHAAAALGLAHIGTPAAIDALVAAIASTPDDLPAGHYLILALGGLANKESYDYLARIAEDTRDPRVEHAALTALARERHSVPRNDGVPEADMPATNPFPEPLQPDEADAVTSDGP